MADDLDDKWWMDDKNPKSENSGSGDDSEKDKIDSEESKVHKSALKSKKGKKQSTLPEKGAKKKSTKKRKKEESSDEEEAPKTKEQKTENEDKDSSEGKQKEKSKKKRKKKKTKTEELKEKPVLPLKPDDLKEPLDAHYKDKLSTVELDDVQVKDEYFTECNDMTHTAVSYMKTLFPKWTKILKDHSQESLKHNKDIKFGSPVLLIISPSALRAAQLNRDLASFKGEKCKTAKLFAKHLKMQEQVKFLSKSVLHIGLGTPNRIQALLENGALSLENTKRIVIDWSWRDIKLRRLIEIPEIKSQLFELLKTFIIPKLKCSSSKLGLM